MPDNDVLLADPVAMRAGADQISAWLKKFQGNLDDVNSATSTLMQTFTSPQTVAAYNEVKKAWTTDAEANISGLTSLAAALNESATQMETAENKATSAVQA